MMMVRVFLFVVLVCLVYSVIVERVVIVRYWNFIVFFFFL